MDSSQMVIPFTRMEYSITVDVLQNVFTIIRVCYYLHFLELCILI